MGAEAGSSELPKATRRIDPAEISARHRYHLMTSLVVPRPIGWLSTWSGDGVANLAPFSYFSAICVSPMLVGVSIGNRNDGYKDTLVNLRARGAFCVNVVTEALMLPMNESSASVEWGVDEFELAGLARAESDRVDAPFVAACPAVLECTVRMEVDLGDIPNTLVIGEVIGVRLSEELTFEDDTLLVRPESLRPVGRLGGAAYGVIREVERVLRPDLR
ncbi:MAG: flavin reductase family protein [Gemmatimonadota bacterium]|nr:flavin reductase family protein [Gemmatimonadota bacterium]